MWSDRTTKEHSEFNSMGGGEILVYTTKKGYKINTNRCCTCLAAAVCCCTTKTTGMFVCCTTCQYASRRSPACLQTDGVAPPCLYCNLVPVLLCTAALQRIQRACLPALHTSTLGEMYVCFTTLARSPAFLQTDGVALPCAILRLTQSTAWAQRHLLRYTPLGSRHACAAACK